MVGMGKRIITPNPLLPVSGGMGPTRPTREKRGELTARAVYLLRGNVGIAVVSLDQLGFPAVLGDRVRARVPKKRYELRQGGRSGAKGNRTPGLFHAMEALYQLSYSPEGAVNLALTLFRPKPIGNPARMWRNRTKRR